MVGEEISEKEYSSIIGVGLNARETVYPVKIDGDNDGIEDFMRLYYWGGTGGFRSAEFYISYIFMLLCTNTKIYKNVTQFILLSLYMVKIHRRKKVFNWIQ